MRSTALLALVASQVWASEHSTEAAGIPRQYNPGQILNHGEDFTPRRKWADAHAAAKSFLKDWSLEEKVGLTTGVGWMGGRCVGNIDALSDKGWDGLCLEDSPLGVRLADYVTAFPAGINTAATFDRHLMRRRGEAMGKEFRGKGVHIALGPAMNLARAPEGGRLWESFGGDPYLQGEAAYETIRGIQDEGVQACAKHYLNNEQERFRTTSSSNVDDRTQHEVYLHPFLRSVQAGVASVMCSYMNGTWACENPKLLNDLLKRELGFEGYVMSDWQATHSTDSANQGLDMTMPGDVYFGSKTSYFGPSLVDSVNSGSTNKTRVDDMAERIVAAWLYTGQDKDFPAVNFNAFDNNDPATNEHVDVQDDHYKLVREIGAASTVLLKNNNNALPLKKPRSIALIGSDAGPPLRGPNGYNDRGGTDGTLAVGWGSGTTDFPYLISPLEAIQARARKDRTSVSWWLHDYDISGATSAASYKDVAIVFVKSDSGEGYITVDGNEGDRNNLTAWSNGDALVKAVASSNSQTIVVVHSVGPMIVEAWVDHPNVTAVVWAGMPGQESGNSLVDILWGDVNPSGRLPYTIAKTASDYAAHVVYTGGNNPNDVQIPYTEGLLLDYRWFDAHDIKPRYEFGFGLSYTNFTYSDIEIVKRHDSDFNPEVARWEHDGVTGPEVGASVAEWLHEIAYEVKFNVKNTGSVEGWEVPQLYLHPPPSANSAPSILRGFDRISISPGETAEISFPVSRYDLSIWDVARQGWAKPSGAWRVSVGASSKDFRLHGTIS
ncbi:glycoside hydrolase family 3 protein [Tulasnella calospora MUT 4182]|uniref:beta-glucosidase n=1 Tax=Tulasnella calospora MUT 4182 TaxID=1051891 RepID=A0A0C3Q335_9AGAM|nr:glycoside hydrolase family 3 protein [Tulasnella calospora MUT 4182]